MEYRFFGQSGIKVSRLCFGTMSFGGEADEGVSARLFHACRERGVNFFDCADVYNKGRSEKILGALIKDCRQEVVVTSNKYGAGRGPQTGRLAENKIYQTRYGQPWMAEAADRELDPSRPQENRAG